MKSKKMPEWLEKKLEAIRQAYNYDEEDFKRYDLIKFGFQKCYELMLESMEMLEKQRNKFIKLSSKYAEEILSLKKSMKPRPIETAPKDGTMILLGRKNSWHTGFYTETWGVFNFEGFGQPTHWLPLPEIEEGK